MRTTVRHSVSSVMPRISALPSKVAMYQDFVSTMEMDNHADTHCFGRNFTPILFTGQSCDVTAFSEKLSPITQVPICMACTAYDDPDTGLTTILEFPQGLWMPDHMDHSLINLNQCCAFGINICDDPFDPNRKLGIHDPNTDSFIPLMLEALVVLLKTCAPSTQEIQDNVRHIIMSDETPWDPQQLVSYQIKQLVPCNVQANQITDQR